MATQFTAVPPHCDWGAFAPQVTYGTPLKKLTAFVDAILRPFSIQSATVELQVIVFEPRELIAYCATQGIQTDEPGLHDKMLSANTKESTAELLEATLGDWIDFFLFLNRQALLSSLTTTNTRRSSLDAKQTSRRYAEASTLVVSKKSTDGIAIPSKT